MPNDQGNQGASPSAASATQSRVTQPLLLLMCALLAAVVVAVLTWSYAEVRQALIEGAKARFDSAGQLLAREMSTQLTRLVATAGELAKLPAVREPEAAQPGDLEALRSQFRQTTVVEIWRSDGTRAWKSEPPAAAAAGSADTRSLFEFAAPRPTGERLGVQPFRVLGKSILLEVHAAIAAGDGGSDGGEAAPRGWLVLRRVFTGGGPVDFLAGLIGPEARLLVGNAGDDAWSDLKGAVPRPRLTEIQRDQQFVDEHGDLRLAVASPIKDTPLLLVAEGPASHYLAPAQRILVRLALAGLAILALGLVGAFWINRRFAKPLRDATEAAEEIAAGNLQHRLPRIGTADVRRFAGAFNVMADRVEDARRDLEARVDRRTADLSTAMEQLHAAQAELVRKEKLATLGQLAGGVGHELRNPLGVMMNAVFYLDMVLDNATPEVREYLGIIRQQIQLSEKIIADLFDFSRSRQPVAQAVRLEQAGEQQLARLPANIAVVRTAEAGVPAAKVDPVHLEQILQNLVQNARQAMGETGTLTIRTSKHGDKHVRVEIEDTGPGVPAELVDRIFEPLFTTKPRGIGLGLAVSRQLAVMNAGELRLETKARAGATFALILPVAEAS